jgi:hypothetical protein
MHKPHVVLLLLLMPLLYPDTVLLLYANTTL